MCPFRLLHWAKPESHTVSVSDVVIRVTLNPKPRDLGIRVMSRGDSRASSGRSRKRKSKKRHGRVGEG